MVATLITPCAHTYFMQVLFLLFVQMGPYSSTKQLVPIGFSCSNCVFPVPIPSIPSPTTTFSQPFSLQLSHTPQSSSEFLGTPLHGAQKVSPSAGQGKL